MLNMSILHMSLEKFPDEVGTNHHDAMENLPPALTYVSKRGSILSVWSTDDAQTETFDAERAPRLRRRSTILSMSTHYTESSFGSHTELSEMLITRTVSSAGMRHKPQKPDPGFSIARERRKRLQQERLSRAVRPREHAPKPVLKKAAEPGTLAKSTSVRSVPLKESEGVATLDVAHIKPEPETISHQRIASAEATARLIRHAREILNASKAEVMRLKGVQNETGCGDSIIPQRRNTTGVLPRKTAANIHTKRATADSFDQVNSAPRGSGSIAEPSERIQKLMARFDREIKARVEADIEKTRPRKQAASPGKLQMLDELEDSNMGSNKVAMQAQRPKLDEQGRARSSNETLVVNEEEQMDNYEVRMARELTTGSRDLNEEVGSLNQTTTVEDDLSAVIDLSIISSYNEGSVISEKAVAAPMVPVRKARLVKVTPRLLSVKYARNEHDCSQGSPKRLRSPLGLSRSPNRTPTKHLVDRQSGGNSSPRLGLNKREMQLAQRLQPEDFVVSTDIIEELPEETERISSRSTSPFARPIGALSCHLGVRDEEQYDDDQDEEQEDTMSLSSADCVADDERFAPPTVPLFNMPNIPFLYHTEHDDDCPSLTTDDDQDHRSEETADWLGARQDQAPPLPSPTFHPGPTASAAHVEVTRLVALTGASTNGRSTHAITRGKYAQVNVEIEGDGFSAIGDSHYEGRDSDGCKGNRTLETEEYI